MAMLDPHAYYTELSLFVSTSAAIHILQGAFVRAPLAPRRDCCKAGCELTERSTLRRALLMAALTNMAAANEGHSLTWWWNGTTELMGLAPCTHTHTQRKARRGIAERMYNTSPLTRTVLGEPAAPEARRLLHSEARAKTKLAGGFAASKAHGGSGSSSRGEAGVGEASQSQRAAHGILSDEHRAELFKLSTKLQRTRNALPDKRYQ